MIATGIALHRHKPDACSGRSTWPRLAKPTLTSIQMRSYILPNRSPTLPHTPKPVIDEPSPPSPATTAPISEHRRERGSAPAPAQRPHAGRSTASKRRTKRQAAPAPRVPRSTSTRSSTTPVAGSPSLPRARCPAPTSHAAPIGHRAPSRSDRAAPPPPPLRLQAGSATGAGPVSRSSATRSHRLCRRGWAATVWQS